MQHKRECTSAAAGVAAAAAGGEGYKAGVGSSSLPERTPKGEWSESEAAGAAEQAVRGGGCRRPARQQAGSTWVGTDLLADPYRKVYSSSCRRVPVHQELQSPGQEVEVNPYKKVYKSYRPQDVLQG